MPQHLALHPKSQHVSKTAWWAHNSKLHSFLLRGVFIAKFHECLVRQHQAYFDYFYEFMQQGFDVEAAFFYAWNKFLVSLLSSFVRSDAYRAHYILASLSSTNIAPTIIGLPSMLLVRGSMPLPTRRQHDMTGEMLSLSALLPDIVVSSVLKLPKKWHLGRSQYLTLHCKPALLVKVLDNKFIASVYFWGCHAQVLDYHFRVRNNDIVLTKSVKTIRFVSGLDDCGPYDSATKNSLAVAFVANRLLLAEASVRNKLNVCLPDCENHIDFDTIDPIA